MATRAGAAPDWRAAFRRSVRRATPMAGAGVLFDLTQDDFRAKMADYAAYGAPGGEWVISRSTTLKVRRTRRASSCNSSSAMRDLI